MARQGDRWQLVGLLAATLGAFAVMVLVTISLARHPDPYPLWRIILDLMPADAGAPPPARPTNTTEGEG